MNELQKIIVEILEQMQRLTVKCRATEEILSITIAKICRESHDPDKWMKGLQQEIAERRAEAMSHPEAQLGHKEYAADVMEQVDRFFQQFDG